MEDLTADDVLTVKRLADQAGFDHIDPESVSRVASAAAVQLRRAGRPELLMTGPLPMDARRVSHSYPPGGHRADPANGRGGSLRDPGLGREAPAPTFDDLVFLTASISRYPSRDTAKVRDAHRPRHPPGVQTGRAGHPDHHRRDELRGALVGGEGRARPRRDGGRHLDDDRRRRDDRRGARGLAAARLPVPAVPLRLRPGRPAAGRCDRDRRRAGRQAGRRRDAARPEGQRAGRRDAHAARRISQRSASRRTGWAPTTSDQDRGTARGDRTGRSRYTSSSVRPGWSTT